MKQIKVSEKLDKKELRPATVQPTAAADKKKENRVDFTDTVIAKENKKA